MGQYDALLEPLAIKGLTIRNRIMSTAHAPSYAEDGKPKERYQLYHEEKAKGGIGLTCFGGSSSVAPDSPATAWNQVSAADDSIIPYFQEFARRVHRHGAALMCQLTHMGRRNRWDTADWLPLIAPSPVREPQHRAIPKEMEDWDFRRVITAFGAAARRCKDGGLDGCEILMGAQHLIDQFHTPLVNRRTDRYGGSLENRVRFGLEVLEEVRKRVGDDYIVGARMTGDELAEGGYALEEGIDIARILAASGLVDYLNVFHSHPADHMALAVMIPGMSFPLAPYLGVASAIKSAVDLPVFHAGRINDLATARRALEEGHIDMVGMTRAHMADPHVVAKLERGEEHRIRPCVGAGYCIDRIYQGGETLCIHNPATGRERTMPHVVPRTKGPGRKVVVVGGGPAGLEAARVSAARGNQVVLLEAAARLGGQVNLAAELERRREIIGITDWLGREVELLGVDVRLDCHAETEQVLAEEPDVVVVATGGIANTGLVPGSEHAVTVWDILGGAVAPSGRVLLYDETGEHQGPSCAEFMAARGALVELVTPDRMACEETGPTNFAIHLRELYEHGVKLTPDLRLGHIRRDGNKLVAVLTNEYTKAEEERVVDQVVVEHGTLPLDQLYFALKPHSTNLGEVDLDALIGGRPQTLAANPKGRFRLFRVGDAVASRNIHAAIYDSLRLCKDL